MTILRTLNSLQKNVDTTIVWTQKDIQLFEWIVGSALLYFSQTTYEDKFSPDTKTNPTNPGQLKLGNKDIKKDSGLGYNKHQRFTVLQTANHQG